MCNNSWCTCCIGVKPRRFEDAPSLTRSTQFYTQVYDSAEDPGNWKFDLGAVNDFVGLKVNNTPLGIIPTTTGNTTNLNEVVIDSGGATWIIDVLGNARKFNNTVVNWHDKRVAFGKTATGGLDYDTYLNYDYTNQTLNINQTGVTSYTSAAAITTVGGAALHAVVYSSVSAGSRSIINFRRARGSFASPAATVLNDYFGGIVFGGHDGSSFQNGASMETFQDGAASSGFVPTRWSILTGGNSSRVERLTVRSDGKVGIGTTSPNTMLHVTGELTVGTINSDPALTDILVHTSGLVKTRTVASLGIPTVTPAALTKTDDTNVTLTLGGTPSTALLQATSITVGWSGTLAVSRGGTGLGTLGTANQLLRVNAGATALEYFTPIDHAGKYVALNNLDAAYGFNYTSTPNTNSFTATQSIYLTSPTNGPVAGSIHLLSQGVSNTYSWQLASAAGISDSVWFRDNNSGSWGTWYQVASRAWVTSQGYTTNTGTVTNFSAGDLSPLFTTSETLTTTTPALAFALSNCTQYQVFGRSAAGTGAPSYVTLDNVAFTGAYADLSGLPTIVNSTGKFVAINSTDGVGSANIGAVNITSYFKSTSVFLDTGSTNLPSGSSSGYLSNVGLVNGYDFKLYHDFASQDQFWYKMQNASGTWYQVASRAWVTAQNYASGDFVGIDVASSQYSPSTVANLTTTNKSSSLYMATGSTNLPTGTHGYAMIVGVAPGYDFKLYHDENTQDSAWYKMQNAGTGTWYQIANRAWVTANFGASPVWKIDGGTTDATTNTQDIYHNGKLWVGDGSGGTTSYMFRVSGTGYFTSTVDFNNNVGIQGFTTGAVIKNLIKMDSSNRTSIGVSGTDIILPAYPNSRNDAAVPSNYLYTDSSGVLKSGPTSDIAGSFAQTGSAGTQAITANSTFVQITTTTSTLQRLSVPSLYTIVSNNIVIGTEAKHRGIDVDFDWVTTSGSAGNVSFEVRVKVNGTIISAIRKVELTAIKDNFHMKVADALAGGGAVTVEIRCITGSAGITINYPTIIVRDYGFY